MSVHKIKGLYYFHCDDCGESALGDVFIAFSDFYEALSDIEWAGWVTQERCDDSREGSLRTYWHHSCWKCSVGIWP